MSLQENLPINLNFSNNDLVISFSIQFFIMNLLNILFGFYVLLPLMNKKYKNTFSNSLSLVSKLDFFKSNKSTKEEEEELKENNKKYLKVTLKFFLQITICLIILNVYIFIKNPMKYIYSFKKQASFKSLFKALCATAFILLIQLFYFNNFTFSYYLNLILKYIL